jgi:hypothetical protein
MSAVTYIGNFKPQHSTENEILRALNALGHDVTIVQEDDELGWRTLISRVHSTTSLPDVVLWTRTRSLSDQIDERLRWDTLYACSERGIPTVGYHLDRWWGLDREAEIASDPFFRVSLLCTADGGHDEQWKDAGITHAWFPPAISEFEVGCGTPVDEYACDVAFVGSWQGYGHAEWWPHRERMLDAVSGWYGDTFRCFPEPGCPRVTGMDLADLYASAKVVVGDSCLVPGVDGVPVGRYWSDRVPETLGRGGLLVHPWVEGISSILPTYFNYPLSDMDALHERIEMVLGWTEDQRSGVRAACAQRVAERDTYTVRMKQLWNLLGL